MLRLNLWYSSCSSVLKWHYLHHHHHLPLIYQHIHHCLKLIKKEDRFLTNVPVMAPNNDETLIIA